MNDSTDPIRAIATVLAIFISDQLAKAVAPHAAVLIAGMAGAYFGLSSWRQCTRGEAIGYVCGFGLWAWFFATMAVSFFFDAGQHSPYLPQLCAASIGWLGHRIDKLLQRFIPGGNS